VIKDPNNKNVIYNINDKLKINIINELISEFGGKLNFLIGAKGRNIFSYNLNLEYIKSTEEEKITNDLKDIKILLAEDQLFNQMVVKTMARNWDCEIDIVEDGEYVISKLKEKKYDLIIMDIHMPRMDGIEAIKYINENLKDLKIPIIAITGDIYKKLSDFQDLGVSNLIIKPFSSQELFKSIVKALGIYSKAVIQEKTYNYNDTKIYSLEIINKLSKNNEVVKRKMIRVFVKKTLEELKELKNANKQNNLEKVFSISHKMKPAFGYLKIKKAESYLFEIVEQSRKKVDNEQILRLINLLEKEVEIIIKQLKIDFKDLL
jgi:CheY-like chemotaxis protein